MSFETIDVSLDERGVARVALNLPEKRNALSGKMIAELTAFAGEVRGLRAVVLEGRGKVFCAGGDLDWMRQQIDASRATRMAEARKLAGMLRALNEMPVPLIVRVHGGAFGGGVGLACVADVTIAASDAKFGLTETRLGLIPATIGPYVLARIGEGNARRVFMSARLFDAEEAERLGVVARVVDPGALDDAVDAEIAPYLKVAPGAVASAKALARQLGPRIDEDVIEATIEHLADVWETDEAAHGIDTFLSKSAPKWIVV